MPYTALKILAYLLAWCVPAALLYGACRWMQQSATKASTRRMLLVLLLPLAWVIGLAGAFLGQFFHE